MSTSFSAARAVVDSGELLMQELELNNRFFAVGQEITEILPRMHVKIDSISSGQLSFSLMVVCSDVLDRELQLLGVRVAELKRLNLMLDNCFARQVSEISRDFELTNLAVSAFAGAIRNMRKEVTK